MPGYLFRLLLPAFEISKRWKGPEKMRLWRLTALISNDINRLVQRSISSVIA